MRAVDHEGVGFPAADESAGIPYQFTGFLSDAAQHLISVWLAVALVDHMEVIDIQNDCVRLRFRMVLVKLRGVAIEEFLVEESGELVPLGGLNDLPIFREFDDSQYAGQNHIDSRVGLRNKIDRAELQALQLSRLLRSGDDDGDMLQVFICLSSFQHLKTGHDRHEQIQQHQRQRIFVLMHQRECFRTVCGTENLVIVAQIVFENLAVDQFVINDQNTSPASVCAQRLLQVWHLILLLK